MIEFEDVVRRYAQKLAVDGLTLTIPSGELFALLGPNGAGKTTTIKMLTGLLRPTGGSVRVCGNDVVTDLQRASLAVGYVPEEPFLYDKLSGREFLEFVGEMRGLERRLIADRIRRESDYFELGEFIDELTETYSHGMKQRLVFAAALLHDPRVLVIDEPMIGLDPRSVRAVKDRLRDQAAGGMTVFMSTHTLTVAEEIAHRIGIMNHGRLHFLGTVDELRGKLASHHDSLEPLFLELTNGEKRRDGAATERSAAGKEL